MVWKTWYGKIDWREYDKIIVFTVLFTILWFLFIPSYSGGLEFQIQWNGIIYHIHHSLIGIIIIVGTYIVADIWREEYDWLWDVLIAIGASLLIHHLLTEGFIFLTTSVV